MMGGQGAANMRMAINMVPSFGDFYVTNADGVSTVGNCTTPVNPSSPARFFPVSQHLLEPAFGVMPEKLRDVS